MADRVGVDLEDANQHILDFASSMGMPIDEAVEHMIGALQYLNTVRNPGAPIVWDSLAGCDPEPREQVDWKKEGF
jgi:hypothetical protein